MRSAPLGCLLLCLLPACDGCSDAGVVAELVSLERSVDRDHAASREEWKSAAAGAMFRIGDGLRTAPDASAELVLSPDGRMRVEADTIVRFQDTPPGQAARRVDVETGQVELEAQAIELEVRTPVGLARVSRGSRVKIRSDARNITFDVAVGKVDVQRRGEPLSVSAGESFDIDVGELTLEKRATTDPAPQDGPKPVLEVPQKPAAPTPAAVPPAQPQTGAASQGGAELPRPGAGGSPESMAFQAGPKRVHTRIPAGESFTVHDPSPPTRLRLETSKCPGPVGLEIARGGGAFRHSRTRGTGGASLELAAGRYRYRLRCFVDEVLEPRPVASGSITVRRDAATRRLPRTAPSVPIDADGRRYTVRYQNHLPEITLRWRGAPQAERYTLVVDSPRGRKLTRSLSTTRHTFKSGQLAEGQHDFHFSAAGRTAQGRLAIAFDNTARSAYLSSPGPKPVASGPALAVAGAALSRSRVSVLGEPVRLSGQGRFQTRISPDPGLDALAVRVQHPSTGIHYYLRRLSSTAP